MKIDIQPREDHQVKITTEIESERFEQSKRKAARKISQQNKIPGFRPGKAPYDIVRRMVGDEAIVREAVELLVDEVYPEVIKQSEITPYGPGSLEELANMDPVTFSFIVPLAPTVDLGDYRSVREAYEPPAVDEKQVDEFVERLRSSYATIEPAERAAQEGDLVSILVSGRRLSPAEGEEAEIVNERPLQVTIDPVEKTEENEWPFPGFGRMLIGMSANEEKTIPYTFPEDSKYEALRGKDVEYTVKVQAVKSMTLPEVNDEFAQQVGEFENLEALRKVVRENLESTTRSEYDQDFFNRVIDQMKEKATIKYPPQALDEEIHQTEHHLADDLARQNMDLDTYLKLRKVEHEEFVEKELKPAAVSRLERSLLLEEIGRAEKIELSQEDLEQSFTQTLQELQYSGEFEQLSKKVPAQRLANAVAMEAANRLMNRRVFERLQKVATGTADAEPAEETAPSAAPESVPAEEPEQASDAKAETE
ncbi:MAG TPA: trigger factor [Anaerolineaceae bacterium]|nr:trigger factor [Anaerolineaceae bacterium]